MNSRVSVDAENEVGGTASGCGENTQKDYQPGPSVPHDGSGGNVVLVLPSKDNIMARPSSGDDAIPVMVNGVPVYISQTGNGSPLYIRQYPPTLEEIMVKRPEDLIANFDGFSEASGQTFEGFSEGSCSSVLFEGFCEDALHEARFSIVDSLGRLIKEEMINSSMEDDSLDSSHDLDTFQDTQHKSKSTKKSTSKRGKGNDSPAGSKRSRSSDSPGNKKVKLEVTKGIKSALKKHTTTSAMTTTGTSSKRRQSADKQDKKPLEILIESKKPRKLLSPEDPDYIGQHCNEIGCTVSFLERMGTKDVKVCNGVVQELCDFASRIYWGKEYVARWIQRLNGVKTEEPLEDCDVNSIHTVIKRRKALATIHSGNQYLKGKLRSFDEIEFILPSLAKRQESEDKSELKSHKAKRDMKEETSPVTNLESVTPAKENKNRRHVKDSGNDNNMRKEQEKTINQTVEKTDAKEIAAENTSTEEKRKDLKKGVTENDESDRCRQNEDEEQQTSKESNINKTDRRISTRRSSMIIAKDEEEKKTNENEEKKDRKGNNRASIAPKEEEHNNNRGKVQASDRKKAQLNNKEQKVQDDQNHEKKENADPKKDSENQVIQREEEYADKTEKEETKPERRISSRRASMLVTKQEKERSSTTDGPEKNRTPQRLKRETIDDKRRNNVTTNSSVKSEDEQRLIHKADRADLSAREVHYKEAKERKNKTMNEGEKAVEKENQGVCGLEVEKIGTRRSSIVARQEKEKQDVELAAATQGNDNNDERKKSERIGARRDKESGKMQDKKQEKNGEASDEIANQNALQQDKESGKIQDKKQEKSKVSDEIDNQNALESDKRIGKRRKTSILLKKQKGDEQVTDCEIKSEIVQKEKEMPNTDTQVMHPPFRIERVTRRDKTNIRRASVMVTKLEEDITALTESRTTNIKTKLKQGEGQDHEEEGNIERKQEITAKEKGCQGANMKGLRAANEEESIDKETRQTVDKAKNNRRSRSRSMIANERKGNEVIDKEDTILEDKRETRNSRTSKENLKVEEQKATEQEKDEASTDKASHCNSVLHVETQADQHKFVKGTPSTSANDEQDECDQMENEKKLAKERKEKQKNDKTTLTEEGKKEAKRGHGDINEKYNTDCEESQIVLKRNKIMNRDKRISRWQNRKINKHEDKTNMRNAADVMGGGEVVKKTTEAMLPYSICEQTMSVGDDCENDDSDDDNLVIDEGDISMQSDESEYTSMQSDTHSTPRKRKMRMSGSSEALMGKRQMMQDSTENSLPRTPTDSSEDQTKHYSPGRKRKKGSQENQDSITMETSSHDATSPANAETLETPQGTDSSYSGTLGVSKSGRLRKASAKGIQSIEIKCLFMQRNNEAQRPPPPLPDLKNEQNDKDWVQEKKSPVKQDRKDKDYVQEVRSPVKHDPKGRECMPLKKSPVEPKVKRPSNRFSKIGNDQMSYTQRDGHLVPCFKETNYYLGDYCCKAGITVRDLNADSVKKVKMTNGMIKELHDFYKSRGATKTSLAIRLFKINGKKILDNTHLLSTVIRITSIAGIKQSDKVRLNKEFILPIRITYRGSSDEEEEEENRQPKKMAEQLKAEAPQKLLEEGLASPNRVRRSIKKRCVKPEDSGDEESLYCSDVEEDDLSGEILLTCGDEGSITRGDIVHLYTKWLKDKMSLGSNIFVTDLLRSVEQLMAERHVAPIRIPAGTLMSSSVRLHDEYKQILKISKEDAVMYLQEDWLEDIRYLLSISGPSRRNTTEGEATPGVTAEPDTPTTCDKQTKGKTVKHHSGDLQDDEMVRCLGGGIREDKSTRHHSGVLKEDETLRHYSGGLREQETPKRRSVGFKEEETPRRRSGILKKEEDRDYEGTYQSKAVKEALRGNQMESVGKRQGKRKNIRESLQEYERDILQELEKAGMLEEEEEDILSQLDREEDVYESEEEEEDMVEKKKREKHKGTKKLEKVITAIQKSVKPTDESDFEVDKIVDYQEIHDKKGKHIRYLVRWIGFGPEDDSWVNERNLQCPSILEAFWKKQKRPLKPDRTQSPIKQDHKSPGLTGTSKQKTAAKNTKKDGQSMIQAMVKHDSAQQGANINRESPVITKRELLSLYDNWRQENQDELIAGGSNTVNVDLFKGRVKDLMVSRNIEFHSESLLNACFMMTLMKTRLQNKMALNRFLDTSCLEVLESCHRQYLKRKYSQIEVVPSRKYSKDQKHTVLSLQNELQSLKLDLTTAQKWRAVKSSQLGAVEEEVDYLETAVDIPDTSKKTKKIMYFKQELQKLKKDIKVLENCQRYDSNDKSEKSIEIPLFGDISSDSENYRKNSKIVRNKLMNMAMSKTTVNTIMDVVARRVSGGFMQE